MLPLPTCTSLHSRQVVAIRLKVRSVARSRGVSCGSGRTRFANQRVNEDEDDYFTELLIEVVGEDFFKAQPFYCKLDDSLQVKLDSNLCTEDDR
jgi:hypothetical protein